MEFPDEADFDLGLSERLLKLLGEDGYLLLVEHYGGQRLYIPKDLKSSDLADYLTRQHALKLCAHYQGGYIPVPLARDFIVKKYLQRGFSRRKIIRTLRITESGYEKLIARLRRAGDLDADGAA